MRKRLFGPTCVSVLLALGAGPATAKDNVALQGSDTLEQITMDVLAACPGATSKGITYRGGGSTTGGNAMVSGAQTVSPQSRFLSTTEGCTNAATSEGLVLALDGLSIVAGATNANSCGGSLAFSNTKSIAVVNAAGAPVINCPGCDTGTSNYRLSGWRDVLALVYGGVHHTTPVVKECASDVRRSLVSNWANLFEGACPGGTCAGGLKRAFRRADLSGTTDTFVSLVGLGSIPLAKNVPGASARAIDFCNAYGAGAIFGGDSDYLDNDPIRVPCDAREQACGRTGSLGLVTVVEVPANLSTPVNYPTQLCGFGQFRFLRPAAFGGPTTCPNGLPKLFNKCFQPVIVNADGSFTADCLARRFPVQGFAPNGMDGRAYNLVSKDKDGLYRQDNLGRFITGAFYRVHTTETVATGAATCQRSSATDQIGCLSQANACTVGFAGREAVSVVPGIVGLRVNGIEGSRANIENLVLTSSTTDDYPLARKLYFNSIIGFENPTVRDGEYELARCMGRSSLVGPIALNRGFIPVPGGVACEDFRGDTCATNPSAVNACANNPADLLSP